MRRKASPRDVAPLSHLRKEMLRCGTTYPQGKRLPAELHLSERFVEGRCNGC